MKTKLFFLISFVCSCITNQLLAQQNAIWSLPGKYLRFGGGNPTLNALPTVPTFPPGPAGYDGDPAASCHNSMQDAQGNLLFFIVDNAIYDKDGLFMCGLLARASLQLVRH